MSDERIYEQGESHTAEPLTDMRGPEPLEEIPASEDIMATLARIENALEAQSELTQTLTEIILEQAELLEVAVGDFSTRSTLLNRSE